MYSYFLSLSLPLSLSLSLYICISYAYIYIYIYIYMTVSILAQAFWTGTIHFSDSELWRLGAKMTRAAGKTLGKWRRSLETFPKPRPLEARLYSRESSHTSTSRLPRLHNLRAGPTAGATASRPRQEHVQLSCSVLTHHDDQSSRMRQKQISEMRSYGTHCQ